ncbi:MAG: FAD-dependent oxidoreductase [Candidatus Micrarchaeia archaeon]|jgi:Na+-transporting NADH:ubiquinone oxidoreductase subunit F
MAYCEHRIARIEEVTESVRIFHMNGEAQPFQPGNFFLIRLPGADGKKVFRSFSAASHPSEGSLRFCVKKSGMFTSCMWGLRAGDCVEIDGPYGIFTLDEKDSARVFIAGGTGIAPLRSMILQTIIEGKPACLFHSASTQSSLAYAEEMELLESKNPSFRCIHAVTRQEMPDGWNGIRGRITADAIAQRLGALEGKTFYICGPKEMVEALVQGLAGAGVPKERIKKEEWG